MSDSPALGELAREIADIIASELGDILAADSAGQPDVDDSIRPRANACADAILQLVALATGGGQGQDQLHSGSTMKNQQLEPVLEGESSARVRVSSADLAPLQIAASQAGRLGRWICEDSLGFVEFDSQEEADRALVAAYWSNCMEVTEAQAEACFRVGGA